MLWMPFLFGIGFIAPLTAQTLQYWELDGPFGMSPLVSGLLLGTLWGAYAQIRGRWI